MGKIPKNLKGYSIALPLAFAHVMVEHGLSEITDKFVLLLSDRGVMTPVTRQPIDREWTRKYYNRHKTEILALVNKLKEEEEMAKKAVSETVKGWKGLLKDFAELDQLYPSREELKGQKEGGRTKAWDKLETYYKKLAEICKKVMAEYFPGDILKDAKFSTAKLRAEWTDKKKTKKNPHRERYDKFKKEIRKPLEDEGLYDNVWAGLKLAYIDSWLTSTGIKNHDKLTYRQKWELVQVKDETMRKAVVNDFLSDYDTWKDGKKNIKSLQDIIAQRESETALAKAMPKVDADATLDYDMVMAKLKQGELSVLTNHSMLAVASKALSDGKDKELGKRLAEIRDTELKAITKSIDKLMVILEVEE